MRQIQTALSCKKKLAPDRGHCIIDLDYRSRRPCRLSSHEPGRTSPDDCNLHCWSMFHNLTCPNSTYSLTMTDGLLSSLYGSATDLERRAWPAQIGHFLRPTEQRKY